MSRNFIPYEQKQCYPMPPSITDWVAENSLARFVSDLLDEMDVKGRLEVFYVKHRADGWGHTPHHPLMMLQVLIYGYCIGVTSSRKLSSLLESDVCFRYLSGNQHPDFRTISDFRKNNIDELGDFFVEVLSLCREAGLARMGRVALDGRRVAGNASPDRNRELDHIRSEVERILSEARARDADEAKTGARGLSRNAEGMWSCSSPRKRTGGNARSYGRKARLEGGYRGARRVGI